MATWLERARATGYILGQRSVGADQARRACIDALDIQPGDRILDVGCGPAYYVEWLPDCDYVGFDTNAAQLSAARERFAGRRARFVDGTYTEQDMREQAPFDKVLLLGILHHIDDAGSRQLLDLVARSLKPGGRAVALDTPLYEGQSTFSRFLAKNDRGDFLRRPQAYIDLAKNSFDDVETKMLGDTLTMPFSFFLMLMAGPRAA
jgi:SAM-dependent methyltransferase